jgi:hypothetical protein
MCELARRIYGKECFVSGQRCFMAPACTNAAIDFTVGELQAQNVNVNRKKLVIQEKPGDPVTTIRVFNADNMWKKEGEIAVFQTGTFTEFNAENAPRFPTGIYNR